MFERLKRVLVKSFVGAIALGWLLAQVLTHFVGIFTAPIAGWISRSEWGNSLGSSASLPAGVLLKDGVPELVRFFGLLILWYVLLRWLYFTPLKGDEPPGPTS